MILFGTEGTDNVVHKAKRDYGYHHVTEYIPMAHPDINTLAKLQLLRPSEDCSGDRELAFEMQNRSFLI